MMAQLNGRYIFDQDDNYEAYLKAADVGMIQRTAMASTKPDILVDVKEDQITIAEVTTLRTIEVSFRLGQEYKHDPGTGRSASYVTVLQGDDTLATTEVDDPTASKIYKFTNDSLVITLTTKGVTATRTFRRA